MKKFPWIALLALLLVLPLLAACSGGATTTVNTSTLDVLFFRNSSEYSNAPPASSGTRLRVGVGEPHALAPRRLGSGCGW